MSLHLTSQPGPHPLSYLAAIAINEIEWAKTYAKKPRLNMARSATELEMPREYIDLIQKFLDLVPYLASQLTPLWTWLSHPDLYFDDIFVDPQTM